MFDTHNLYTCSCVGATHQYNDSRRLFNDSKASRTEQVLKNKLANKRKGFRKEVSLCDVLHKHLCEFVTQ